MRSIKGAKVLWKDTKRILGMPISFTHYALIKKEGYWVKLVRERGILSTEITEVMLYRVDDTSVFQSLTGKLFGVGHVYVSSDDDDCPELMLKNIANPYKIHSIISDEVELCRKEKGVRFSEIGR